MTELIPAMPLLMSDYWVNVEIKQAEHGSLAINTLATHKQMLDAIRNGWFTTISGGYLFTESTKKHKL